MYTVVWLPLALRRLADIWNAAADRNAVTAASNRIDVALAADPTTYGEERTPNRRLAFDPPLGVYFQVDTVNRVVRVLSVGLSRPAGRSG